MRDYEVLYIVRPELTEEELGAAVQKVTSLIENLGGTQQRTNVWGKRRLAYEIAHLREGYYVLTDFEIDQERVPELEATLKISETVFRHQVVRKPRAVAAAAAPAAAEIEPQASAPDGKAAAGEGEGEGDEKSATAEVAEAREQETPGARAAGAEEEPDS